jgi:hypothetical protein
MAQPSDEFRPGQRVRLVQQIAQRDEVWTTELTGTVVRYEQRQSGSWFAHAKGHRIWLDRLVLRKDDGEVVVCNLDSYSHIEVLDETGTSPAAGSG